MLRLIILLGICIILGHSQTSQDDYVQMNIPGYSHSWYSGYFNFTSKDIHYMYLESQNDKDNDPLVLWVSGGPGCSGIYSMYYEIGPFRFLTPENLNLTVTKDAWNLRANLLIIETSAIGFSTGSVNSTDSSVVNDLLNSLVEFYARFPTQKKNNLHLAGHGYAGIIVPMLAKTIDQRNKLPYFTKINLKGFLLGNPCTTANECYASGSEKQSYYHYEYLYNHNFLTETSWNQFNGACGFDYNSGECYRQRDKIDQYIDGLNITNYNIYQKCYKTANQSENIVNTNCDDEKAILTLMNDENYQDAIHVNKMKWEVCNMKVFEKYLGENTGSYEIYKELIALKKYNILIYSGDHDSTIPTIGTKLWISRLKEDIDLPVRRTWREWWVPGKHPHEDQVGGMVWEIEGITLATVKGAGYAVGRDKPVALYEIFDAFMNNKRLPLTSTVSNRQRFPQLIW